MKIFFSLLFTIIANTTLFSSEKTNILLPVAEEIIRKEIIKNSCVLTEDETKEAVKKYLETENISVTTFSKASAMMIKLIEGLRLVVEKNELPDEVYKKLKLEHYGISKNNWAFYLTNYKNTKKIDSLEQWIPNNSDIIIKSACIQFKPIMERFLLEQFILFDFDIKNSDKVSLPDSQKKMTWWIDTLNYYSLNQQERKDIIPFLVCFFISEKQQDFFSQFFKDRLKKMQNSLITSGITSGKLRTN